MRRLLLVAAVLAFAAVWAWMQVRTRRSVDSVSSPSRALEDEAASLALDPPARASAPQVTMREEARGPSMGAETVRGPASTSPAGSAAFVVHVVDEDEQPVAGATVRFVDLVEAFTSSPWRDLRDLMDDELDTLAERLGTRFVSDEEGLVRVPRTPGGIAIAELGDTWGWTFFDPESYEGHEPNQDEHETIVLNADLALDVLVVDRAGTPVAGVPVALRQRDDEKVHDVFRTPTDEHGRARLRHLQEVLEDGVVGEGTSVSLSILTHALVEHALLRGPLPREPIRLVVPDTGSLEIRLEDAEGKLIESDARIELEVAPKGERSEDEEWRRKYLDPSRDDRLARVFARGGRARIEHIGLALDLDLRVEPVESFRPLEVRASGPRTPGEQGIAHVRGLEPLVVLTGTIRRPDGSPWGDRRASADLWLESDLGQGCSAELATDANGRFDIPIDGDWPLEGRLSIEFGADEPDGRRWWHREEWDVSLVPGTNDVGVWVIEPLPVILAGTLVDTAGKPLAGAWIGLAKDRDAGQFKAENAGSDGRFLLQGHVDAPRVAVTAGCDGYATRSLEFETGTTGQVVTLTAGGRIEGSVLVSRIEALEDLRVVAIDESGARREAELDSDGHFHLLFEWLAPGRYDVKIELAHEPEFEFLVPGVVVEVDGACRDPHLQPIDLRGVLRTFEVTLVHPEGDTTLWNFVRRRPAGSGPFLDAEDWTLDEPVFTTSHEALDLRITVEGCRTVEFLGESEDRTVELQPPYHLVVRLEPPVALGEHEWLKLGLSSREGAPLPKLFGPRFFDGETVETAVPEPGRYVLELVFLQQAVHDLRETPLPLGPEVVLQVLERDEVQRFEVALPPAAFAAIERARSDSPPTSR